MPPRELKGFYYDETKGKYFRVEPNHRAPPLASSSSSFPYTVDSVKRRKLEDEELKVMEEKVKLSKRSIKRARVLSDDLLGGVLSRELGRQIHGSQRERLITDTLFNRWEAREVLGCEGVNMGDFGYVNREPPTLKAFEWDPYGHGLFYCDSNGRLMGVDEGERNEGGFFFEDPQTKTPRGPLNGIHPFYERRNQDLLCVNNDVSTSINLDPSSRLLLATWMSPSTGPNFHLRKFSGSESANRGIQDSIINFRIDCPTNPGHPTSIWTSTPAPSSSNYAFAIGTEHGIFTISKDTHARPNWLRMDTETTPMKDVFSIAFLSQDPSVLCAAVRSGRIDVLDLRMDLADYNSGHDGIQHATSVSHIKQTNDSRLVVAGLESTLAEYDLRFCRKLDSTQEVGRRFYDGKDFIRRRNMRPVHAAEAEGFTMPMYVFSGHLNDADRGLGFDVDREAGLMAAAQADARETVKIWSWRTGAEVGGLDAARVGRSVEKGQVKALRWVADREERASKSLWIAKGTKIVRYGC